MRQQIIAKNGAKPQGPYSPAILASGPTLYVAGQGPVDPATGKLRPGSFKEQAELTFQNITALLEAAGTSWAHVVRVGVFLADLGNFAEMNEIYQKYLTEPYPARTTVQVVLPPTMAIEVDCIALVPEA
jgi:2-iminobutanoate/2-iminopropanoate deaminase